MLVGHVAKVLLQKLLKDMYPWYDSHIFAEIPMGSEHKRNNSSTSYLGFSTKFNVGQHLKGNHKNESGTSFFIILQ